MRRRLKWIIPLVVLALLAAGAAAYVGQYYHADEAALAAMASGGEVSVLRTDYGWLFDGPSDERAMIFYPGGKVEATAYAPLLRSLAGAGMDACLVEMPGRLAILGINRAEAVMKAHDYREWVIGGHSLGGVCAAMFASSHGDALTGLALLAAYPTKPLPEGVKLVSIYGSSDGVLNMKKYGEGQRYAPADAAECVIQGGNHAQFGSYGPQKGDGAAAIPAEDQVRAAVDFIMDNLAQGSESDA